MNYITQFLSIKKKFFLNKSLVSVVSLLTITLLFVYMFYTGGNHSARIVLTSPNQAIPPKNWSLENKNAYIEFRRTLIQMENLLGNELKLWKSVHDKDIFFFSATKILAKGISFINFKRGYDVIYQKLTYTATINARNEEKLEIEKKKFYTSLKNINRIVSNKYLDHIENVMLPAIEIGVQQSITAQENVDLFSAERSETFKSKKKEKITEYFVYSELSKASEKTRNVKLKQSVLTILDIVKSDRLKFVVAEEMQPENNLNYQNTVIAVLLSFVFWIILILIGNFSIAEYRNHITQKK
ncbi:hypothetical protein N9481_04665 [Pelagibacteraceae bacterium]|nr:hypothetical protein [Pelagibacteraceae bacterium]